MHNLTEVPPVASPNCVFASQQWVANTKILRFPATLLTRPKELQYCETTIRASLNDLPSCSVWILLCPPSVTSHQENEGASARKKHRLPGQRICPLLLVKSGRRSTTCPCAVSGYPMSTSCHNATRLRTLTIPLYHNPDN